MDTKLLQSLSLGLLKRDPWFIKTSPYREHNYGVGLARDSSAWFCLHR